MQMLRNHRRWQRVSDSIQSDGFLPRVFVGIEYFANYDSILFSENEPVKEPVDILGFAEIMTKQRRSKHYRNLADRLHPDMMLSHYPFLRNTNETEFKKFKLKLENACRCVNSAYDSISNITENDYRKLEKSRNEENEDEDLDFTTFALTKCYIGFKLTNAKQHRAISTDMVNEIIQEHVVETEDGDMYEWVYKLGVKYRAIDRSKPISMMLDGKELRNRESLGQNYKDHVRDHMRVEAIGVKPIIDGRCFYCNYSSWSKHMYCPEGRAFFQENKVQFSTIEAKKLFPDIRSNNGNRIINPDYIAFSNAYLNMESLTFMTNTEFESSGYIAAINHINHEVPPNILNNPELLKSHAFFHSVKHTIPSYISFFENDTHAQVQLALLASHYSPRDKHHNYEISTNLIGYPASGKTEEFTVDQFLFNKENCHVASYQQISSSNSFSDSQLQQQSVGKRVLFIDELPDAGTISASSYKKWVSQQKNVNANVKNQQKLSNGTISMGVMYAGNTRLEYSRDGVGPDKSWPDTGCLRRIVCRNKKLDTKPYVFLKNTTPLEQISEKEVSSILLL